jgi:uncharacterized protein (UPF0147 family)
MTQAELLELIDRARTPKQIQRAYKEAEAWLETHPDDLSVRAALEGLVMLEQALRLTG